MAGVTIERIRRATAKDCARIAMLMSQLSAGARMTQKSCTEVIEDANNHLFAAREDGRIVGIGMLVVMRLLTGKRGRIEDVVVDEVFRGQGIGEQLAKALIAAAKDAGLSAVDLSSRPERVAANNLYRKLGFKQRETNVYRLEL